MVASVLITQREDVPVSMVSLFSRSALVASAASFSLVLGSTPAVALNNAPVAVSAEADAITKVQATFDAERRVCTGTAVSPTKILTARHCIDNAKEIEVSAHSGEVIPVISTSVDSYNGLDVGFLNLGEQWTGATLAMNLTRPRTGDVFEFYGMGDDASLRTATGRVWGFGEAGGGYVEGAYNGPLLLAGMQSGASTESGDSGGPIISDGEIIGVIVGSIRGRSRDVVGTPLSSVREFIEGEGRATSDAPVPQTAQMQEPVVQAPVNESESTQLDGASGDGTFPIAAAIAALLTVLLAIGIHSGALDIPGLL